MLSKENEFLATRFVILVNSGNPILVSHRQFDNILQTDKTLSNIHQKIFMIKRTVLPEETVVLENVENSAHLAKDQHTRAFFFHAFR